MDIRHVPIEVDDIVVDHDVMIRDRLDESWVRELAALYEDRHQIDPILLMKDKDGIIRLVHGFYRVAALKMCGHSGTTAEIREGSKDQAILAACRVDHHGLRRTIQEQKKAVFRVKESAEMKNSSNRAIGIYCGIPEWAVVKILLGEEPILGPRVCHVSVPGELPLKKNLTALYAKIDSALRANPSMNSTEISKLLKCNRALVAKRRIEIGVPQANFPGKAKPEARASIIELLKNNPKRTLASIAEEVGVAPSTVSGIRDKLLKEKKEQDEKKKEQAPAPSDEMPSAPFRKGAQPDPRLTFQQYKVRSGS